MKIKINKKAVGSRIKQIRLNKGYTLEGFGKLFGASKGNVQQWENGVSLPNTERIASICKVADITVNELLYGSIDEFIDNNLSTIHEYLTGRESFSSIDEYNDTRYFLSMWLEERGITLENIHYVYDYLEQNTSIPGNLDLETSHIKTLENIKEKVSVDLALFCELVEMLNDNDRVTLFNYLVSRIKNYQLTEKERKYIEKIEKYINKRQKN